MCGPWVLVAADNPISGVALVPWSSPGSQASAAAASVKLTRMVWAAWMLETVNELPPYWAGWLFSVHQ